MGRELPRGTVTLLLGDLEGSVGHWERDAEAMARAIELADRTIDEAVTEHGGHRPAEQGEGDSFVAAFDRAADAVACALALQSRLHAIRWPTPADLRFRLGLHTGDVEAREGNRYAGATVNRAARIRDLGAGGHTLLSAATRALADGELPDGAGTRALGTVELRGLARPEQVFALVHPDLPDDLPTIVGVGRPLPVPTSAFVGRSRELAEVAETLGDARIVTLTGAGGSGKSRLALEVARASTAPMDAWLVELAPIRDPQLVDRLVADAVGARTGAGDTPVEDIVVCLGERAGLLVLDNCEHLLEPAASLTAELTRRCRGLRVLATSREPLGLRGEAVYRMPSLSTADGLALFEDRARRSTQTFELTGETAGCVTEICRRLDGLPLGIELAAARVRSSPVTQILSDLDDRFRLLTGGWRDALPRQRTLEASVAWSHDLLDDRERSVLARLSVFAGSFTREAAMAVADAEDVDAAGVPGVVEALVDRSLVQPDDAWPGRFRLLETIKVFARERLAELGETTATRDRHLDHYVHAVAEAGVGFATDASTWGPRLDAELDDLRAAVDWALETGRAAEVVRLVADLGLYWATRSRFREVHLRLGAALRSSALDPATRAEGASAAAVMAMNAGAWQAASELAAEITDLAGRRRDDPLLAADAAVLRALTAVYGGRGRNEEITADLDLAESLLADAPPTQRTVSMLTWLGNTQTVTRSVAQGRRTLDRALEQATEDGDATGMFAIRSLRIYCGLDGRLGDGRADAEFVVETGQALGAAAIVSFALGSVAFLEAEAGAADRARRLAREAVAVAEAAGARAQLLFARRSRLLVEALFGDPRDALDDGHELLPATRNEIGGLEESLVIYALAVASHRSGDLDAAQDHYRQARDRSIDPSVPITAGRGALGLALLATERDDADGAWELAHDALDMLAGSDDAVRAPDALDLLARLTAERGDEDRAARLLGATEQARADLGIAPGPLVAAHRAAALERAGHLDEAHREGRGLSLDDAVAYARRGRGERGRPTAGWAALTEAELGVLDLTVGGLRNAEVAEQLFVSVNTVKSHLKSIYRKLDVSNRAQLAAAASHQRGANPLNG